MKTGIQSTLNISICADVDDAIRKGYVFHKPEYTPVSIEKVVIVQGGMASGKASVDFVMEDDDGYKTVFMLSSNLVETLWNMMNGVNRTA